MSCLSHIYALCKSKSSNIWNDKSTTKTCSQIYSAPSTQGPRRQSTHQSPVVTHVNYAKNVLERPAVLELLVLGLFRPFDKIRFSTDRLSKKCMVVVKVFRSTFILTSLTKFCWPWIVKGLNDKQECEG